MGTTASGKTDLAEAVADQWQAQLINADSFQVYRGMDIGTAKSPRKSEYAIMDIKDPDEQFGLGEFLGIAVKLLQSLFQQGRHAVVTGGSGINIRALFEGYHEIHSAPEPELREFLTKIYNEMGLEKLLEILKDRDEASFVRVDQKNPRRIIRAIEKTYSNASIVYPSMPPFRKHKFWINPDKDITSRRIVDRIDDMLANGWIDEVKILLQNGYTSSLPGFQAHGYRWIEQYLNGVIDLDEVRTRTSREIVKYAKRQRTWLRKEPNLIELLPGNNLNLVQQVNTILFANEDQN